MNVIFKPDPRQKPYRIVHKLHFGSQEDNKQVCIRLRYKEDHRFYVGIMVLCFENENI